jgi:hypothetical protein
VIHARAPLSPRRGFASLGYGVEIVSEPAKLATEITPLMAYIAYLLV